MAIEINTVLDLSDGQDKTLDSSFRFLLQDPYIEACLLLQENVLLISVWIQPSRVRWIAGKRRLCYTIGYI